MQFLNVPIRLYTVKYQISVISGLHSPRNSHTLSLHNVNVVLRSCIITIQAQGSPKVGPQFSMTGDKRANYFSKVEKGKISTKISNSP